MAYLNLDPAYFTHRKTVRLVAKLGAGAELLPIRLWAYCAAHHPKDGALHDYSEAELEALLGWQGELGQAISALVVLGFLDANSDLTGWVCHDWLEHQGHLAAFKDRAERAAKARWDKARKLKKAASNAQASPKHASSNTPSLPSVPNQPTTKTTTPELPAELAPYKAAVEDWLAYKRERGQTYKPRGLKALFTSMIEMGSGLPAAVKHSMTNNYAGLYAANGKPVDNKVSAQHQRGLDAYGD